MLYSLLITCQQKLTFILMKGWLFGLCFLVLMGCGKKASHAYTFYYWKTNLNLNTEERAALKKAKDPFLYARFFDVDRVNGRLAPVGIISKDSGFVTDKTIIPVVFFTNRSFVGITSKEITLVAKGISELIEKRAKALSLKMGNEIQIDCDWTPETRDDYFRFLKELKKVSGKTITSTLRLHEVKDYKQTGVPPVDKVYLMCYSMTSPLENSNKNSILDVPLLKNYLAHLQDYPIKNVDVALPIFSWAIVTNQLGRHKLINGISRKDLENSDFQKIGENEVILKKDGFYFGFFLNKGFHIKVEQIDNQQLDDVVDFLNKKIPNFNLIYFQLDSKFLNQINLNR